MRAALVLIACLSASAPPKTLGRLYGTVLLVGNRPNFPNDGCVVHAWDTMGVKNLRGGLSHAVVLAEPLDESTRQWFRSQPSPAVTLGWDPAATERVMTVRPGSQLRVESRAPLSFYIGDARVRTAKTGDAPFTLPEGTIRVSDEAGHAGWVLVTPYPTHISGGNCRFSFELPIGPYRLRAVHRDAGEVSRTVQVPVKIIQLLVFGHKS